MPTFKPKTIDTPARVRLAEIIEAGETIAAAMESAHGALSRLQATATAADPIRQQVAMLDATETSAALEAAREGKEQPEPDTKRRAALNAELESAMAREAAAKRAMPALESEVQRESAKRPGLDKAKSAAIAEILSEEVDALIDEFAVSGAKLAAQAQGLSEIREQILLAVEAGGDRAGYVRLEALDGKLKLAGQRPIVDTAAIRAAWRGFEADLRSDAGAKLAGVA
jgi:hypothetical protein